MQIVLNTGDLIYIDGKEHIVVKNHAFCAEVKDFVKGSPCEYKPRKKAQWKRELSHFSRK